MRVLVIDDNEDAREYLRVILVAAGHSVLSAENGLMALKLLEEQVPDVIISDLLMPKMDGFILLKKIRSSEHLCHIPFIVYTATYTTEHDRQLVEKIGANLFLLKPQEPDVLLAEIESVVKNSTHIETSNLSHEKLLNDYSNTLARKLDKKIQQLQTSEQIRNNFISIMSHEIRTPLQGILSPIELLEKYEIPEESKKLFNMIHRSAKDLLHVFNQLVEVAELQQEQIQLFHKDFFLSDVLLDLSRLFSPSAQEKNLDLQFHKQETIPQILIGDPIRLKQILSNLLSNAIKFSNKGQVVLTARMLSQETQSCLLEFSVSDMGIGIQPEQLDNIFELFNIGGDINTRQFRGTGMGLLITKRLVELMEGKIKVESQWRQGSCFRVELNFPLPAK